MLDDCIYSIFKCSEFRIILIRSDKVLVTRSYWPTHPGYDLVRVYCISLFLCTNVVNWMRRQFTIEFLMLLEAATRGALEEKMFLKISQNSPENTCARVWHTSDFRTPLGDCFYTELHEDRAWELISNTNIVRGTDNIISWQFRQIFLKFFERKWHKTQTWLQRI